MEDRGREGGRERRGKTNLLLLGLLVDQVLLLLENLKLVLESSLLAHDLQLSLRKLHHITQTRS
jgi:hypothetical protein